VQGLLAQSKDVELSYAVGQYLQLNQYLTPHRESTSEMGMMYLRRAVDLDPHFVPAHQAYLRVVLSKKQSDLHTMLMKFPQESRFEAVMKLPEAQRFPALREMALYSYQEGNSLAILDPRKAENFQDLARAYAEELLKLAPRFRSDPDYSGAVFSADILIGLIAARRGDTETAVKYLRDASTVPSSEEMAYFPPFVPHDNLARILAGSGRRADVIAFYEHFAQINLSRRDYLLRTAWNLRMNRPI
jgi:tetratricopeptide (TPR) repeat protein